MKAMNAILTNLEQLPAIDALARRGLQQLPVLGRWLPPSLLERLVTRLLNDMLQERLQSGALTELDNRWLAIDCTDWPYPIRITRCGLRLQASCQRGAIDASIRGDLQSFLILLRQERDPDTLFFQRKLVMQGDTELALAVKNFLDTLEPEQMPAALRWLLVRA